MIYMNNLKKQNIGKQNIIKKNIGKQNIVKQNIVKKNNNKTIFSSNSIALIKNPLLLKNNPEFPKFKYEGSDGFKCVKFALEKDQKIRADAGAMNYMSDQIELETTSGNMLTGIGRMFSGSSFFYNIFHNKTDKRGDISFSGINPGNIGCFYIPHGKSFNLVDDTYICSSPNLDIKTHIRFGGLIMGYGLAFVNVTANNGGGLIFGASFGDVIEIVLNKGDSIKVDNGVLLGFEANMKFNTHPIGGFMSTLFSGEGLVSKIRNDNDIPITLYLQSRSKTAYNNYIRTISKMK